MDIDNGTVTSKAVGVYFDLFQRAVLGFPEGVNFDKQYFIRPAHQTHAGLVSLNQYAATDIKSHAMNNNNYYNMLNIADGANTYVNTVSKSVL